jgi:hypothetical protein
MSIRSGVFAAVSLASLAAAVSPAQADYPYNPCNGWGVPYYRHYGLEHIPFYALHPPVYYSYPVPRPYGYSPFAYPPGTPTPEVSIEVVKPKPALFKNPYFDGAPPEPTTTQATRPKLVINPFVEGVEVARKE